MDVTSAHRYHISLAAVTRVIPTELRVVKTLKLFSHDPISRKRWLNSLGKSTIYGRQEPCTSLTPRDATRGNEVYTDTLVVTRRWGNGKNWVNFWLCQVQKLKIDDYLGFLHCIISQYSLIIIKTIKIYFKIYFKILNNINSSYYAVILYSNIIHITQ